MIVSHHSKNCTSWNKLLFIILLGLIIILEFNNQFGYQNTLLIIHYRQQHILFSEAYSIVV